MEAETGIAVRRFAYNFVILAGALACVLVWLKIEPKDLLGWQMPVTLPHWPWLLLALGLFILGLGSSGYTLYRSLRTPPLRYTPPLELDEVAREGVAFQNKLIELGRSIDGILTPLQTEAIQLSTKLLEFVKELGEPPPPKYTREQFDNMHSGEMKKLCNAHDGDWLEAVEYYGNGQFLLTQQGYSSEIVARCNRLLPWYEKVKARYALEFKEKVETLSYRFAVEAVSDGKLLVPIQGRDGIKNIRAVASKLWELSYTVAEKRNGL
jgi:hypothetical protein